MGVRKIAFACSVLLGAVLGLFAFVQILRGHANMGVDFSGGTLLQYKTEKNFTLEEVRTTLNTNGFAALTCSR
jgi:SecD/SecF fusion protein